MSLIGTMGSGVSALRTFVKGLEVIGNNIANVNTTGYKTAEAKYADSFSNILQRSAPTPASGAGSNTPATQVGTGVMLTGITTNFAQGSLQTTGNPSDLGISGSGFFIVKDVGNNTDFATRAGDFRIDSEGYLVTTQGFRLQGQVGGSVATPISGTSPIGNIRIGINLPAPVAPSTEPVKLQSFSFDAQGNVIESYSDGRSATTNRVLIQNFKDSGALTKEGNNLYSGLSTAGPVSGTLVLSAADNGPGSNGLGRIQSGVLELSNVDLTDQFSNLITTQRSFQAGSRLITVSDSVLEDIVNLKRS